MGYSLWGRKVLDTTERLHFHFHFIDRQYVRIQIWKGKEKTMKYGSNFFFFRVIHIVIYLLFFSFIFISWRLITLQYCSGFCHTLT